jgi:hypothetical protein
MEGIAYMRHTPTKSGSGQISESVIISIEKLQNDMPPNI